MANEHFAMGTFASPDTPHSLNRSDYSTVLNAVDDLGCDPTGNTNVVSRIQNAADNDTLIEFPEGDYYWNGTVMLDSNETNFALAGLGNATIVQGTSIDPSVYWIRSWEDGFKLDSLYIDCESSGTTVGGGLYAYCGGFVIRDIIYYGDVHGETSGGEYNFHLYPNGPSGRIEHCEVHGYTKLDAYRSSLGGIGSSPSATATLEIDHVYLEGRANNGMYLSRLNAPSQITNCFTVNCNITGFRIGHPNAFVEDSAVLVDTDLIPSWVSRSGSDYAYRGVRFETSNTNHMNNASGAEMRNVDIWFKNADVTNAGVQVHGRWGGATVQDSRVQMDDNTTAIRADSVSTSEVSASTYALNVINTHITGSGSGTAVAVGNTRNNSLVDGCCIYRPHGSADGVSSSSSGMTVRNSNINVGGTTFSGVASTSNNTTSGTNCMQADIGLDAEPPAPTEPYDPTDGGYWGLNPNVTDDSVRIGDVAIHATHPFDDTPASDE